MEERKRCPDCMEMVHADAKRCPYCRYPFDDPEIDAVVNLLV